MSRIKATTFGGLRCTVELFICQEQCLILHTGLLELLQAALFTARSRITGSVCFRSSFLACPGEGCPSPGCGMRGPWSRDRDSLRLPYTKNQRQTLSCVGGQADSRAPSTEPISGSSRESAFLTSFQVILLHAVIWKWAYDFKASSSPLPRSLALRPPF